MSSTSSSGVRAACSVTSVTMSFPTKDSVTPSTVAADTSGASFVPCTSITSSDSVEVVPSLALYLKVS
ncbi:hypothetical protein MKHDV_01007 [Halodesulfovibrio sp. MK-HDV]|nr:hypothetical protein MKHDV_01007 [Halodesulfovibrio sp. MK-HDV]